MAQPTIRDVALKAGVGIGTVSRVLNNSPKVSPDTRQRVLDAIAALDFKPNNVARQLPRKTRAHNIGVITQLFISYRSFAERLRGVQLALQEQPTEYELILYSVSSLPHYKERLTTILQTHAVEGLIIIDLDLFGEQEQMLRDYQMPFVGLNHFMNRDWPCIGTDNYAGGYLAARHLMSYGHTRIAYVGDEFIDALYKFSTSYERFGGFKRAMDDAGLPIPERYIKKGIHDYQVAKARAAELFTLPELPTAILAMSDMQALATIAAAREAGLRVPEDLSVIGYDNLEVSLHAGLTTVQQHLEMSGRYGLEHLLRRLQGDTCPAPVLPPLEVIVRQTTRKLS